MHSLRALQRGLMKDIPSLSPPPFTLTKQAASLLTDLCLCLVEYSVDHSVILLPNHPVLTVPVWREALFLALPARLSSLCIEAGESSAEAFLASEAAVASLVLERREKLWAARVAFHGPSGRWHWPGGERQGISYPEYYERRSAARRIKIPSISERTGLTLNPSLMHAALGIAGRLPPSSAVFFAGCLEGLVREVLGLCMERRRSKLGEGRGGEGTSSEGGEGGEGGKPPHVTIKSLHILKVMRRSKDLRKLLPPALLLPPVKAASAPVFKQ
jgi:hypothetical protein